MRQFEVKRDFWLTLPDENADQEVAGYFAVHDTLPWQKHYQAGVTIEVADDWLEEDEFSEKDINYLLRCGFIRKV